MDASPTSAAGPGAVGRVPRPRHVSILLALVLGAACGVAANALVAGRPGAIEALGWAVSNGFEPVGKMWLSALIMVVIPLVVSSLALGVAGLGSFATLGRIGAVTLAGFLSLTATATALGLTLMNLFTPGRSLDPGIKHRLLDTFRNQVQDGFRLSSDAFGIDLLVKIVPRNPVKAAAEGDMLAVIFFALMFGAALMLVPRERAEPMHRFLDSLGAVTAAIIDLVMKAAPLGVFCLIFGVTARFGHELLVNLCQFVAVVVGGLLLFQTVGYALVLRFVAGVSPRTFFREARLVMITAFSTSSSNATLPTTLRVAEENLGVPRTISGFVLPLGATLNMNGTAMYEGATVLFLAQVFGVDLTLGQQLIVMLMSVITAIGVAGIPGGSIPFVMMVMSMVGVPPEGIAVILGMDRVLDMCRTVLNVTGDMVTALVVRRFAGVAADPAPADSNPAPDALAGANP